MTDDHEENQRPDTEPGARSSLVPTVPATHYPQVRLSRFARVPSPQRLVLSDVNSFPRSAWECRLGRSASPRARPDQTTRSVADGIPTEDRSALPTSRDLASGSGKAVGWLAVSLAKPRSPDARRPRRVMRRDSGVSQAKPPATPFSYNDPPLG